MVGSHRKTAKRNTLIPSVLMASVMLSACQQESVSNDSQAIETPDITESGAEVPSTDTEDNLPVATKTPETTGESALIETLSRHRWILVSATDANDQPVKAFSDIADQVILGFGQNQGQNTLNYSVGCNTVNAVYQLEGHTLTAEQGMSTKMSCDTLDRAENLLNTFMQGHNELKIEPKDSPVLTQFTDDEVTLTWKGRLTSQAKYNSKGETVFWAVSPKKEACEANEQQQCLQVKSITYNDQGIKIREGNWRLFSGDIEGYKHDSMHEEVLRLQRYSLNRSEQLSNGTNTAEYAYVLDAIIGSTVAE